jgi:hypothetical protein
MMSNFRLKVQDDGKGGVRMVGTLDLDRFTLLAMQDEEHGVNPKAGGAITVAITKEIEKAVREAVANASKA